ncbi:MAG: ABC transporter substrate-binding protein [Anaerolineae bacterium]|nr:ABC transporter substrate-binding protein [Anaerolineae bacterium]MDW8102993.1 ABC transporter substrate-binding protein [Anaerolineae bacterium]
MRLMALLMLTLVLSSCSLLQPARPVTVRVGVLPILDVLPVYVAEAQGYFPKNIKVEIIPVASAAERDQLMVAGQLDVIINDLISVTLYNRDKPQVLVVRTARTATPSFPQFYILASPKSDIREVKDLRGVEIGISEATIVQYVTEKLLLAEGLKPEEIKGIPVPRIPDRMAALASGDLKAATLPDPLALLAIQQGARLILDDSRHPQYSLSVYSFRKAFVQENPEAVRAFLGAIEKAIKDINSDKARWAGLLVDKKLVPPALTGSYTIPDFPSASVPGKEQWEDVVKWALEKGLISSPLPYEESIKAEYLPR